MTPSQLRIKRIAELLAIALTVAIFSGISGTIMLITGGISLKNDMLAEQGEGFTYELSSPKEFDVEIEAANLKIISGDSFCVTSSDGSVRVTEKKGKVKIEEDATAFSGFKGSEITITLPGYYNAEKFDLSTGAGFVYIEKLSCDKLQIEVGAGKADAEYLKVNTSADIEVGTGEINIDASDINNLNFEVGIGAGYIKGAFNGKTEAEVGIGELILTATPSIDNYTVYAETGIGDFRIAGEEIKGERTVGSGANIINASGGIGSVEINFEQ